MDAAGGRGEGVGCSAAGQVMPEGYVHPQNRHLPAGFVYDCARLRLSLCVELQ